MDFRHVMSKALCYDAKFLNDNQHTTSYSALFFSYPGFVLPFPFLNTESYLLGVAAATVMEDKYIGLILALCGSVGIGSSFIITKKVSYQLFLWEIPYSP